MIEPSPLDVGRKVIYRDRAIGVREEGVIESYNPLYVFVRYGNELTAKGTRRQDLEWSSI